MKQRTLVAILLLLICCRQKDDGALKNEHRAVIAREKKEIEKMLNDWKKDSFGCEGIRDPTKMKIYSKELLGEDSIEIMNKLGNPNFKELMGRVTIFYYFLECGLNKTSYYNAYFYFNDKGKLKEFQTKAF